MRDDMVWNVYVENINKRQIEVYNIFEHGSFMKSVEEAYKKYKNDYDAFCGKIEASLMYYFWAKCEWEIILNEWPPCENSTFKQEKINVYDQVMLNKEAFMKYVWEMAHARKRKKREK